MTYQEKDILQFEGTEYPIEECPLYYYPDKPERRMFLYYNTANYRGYVGHWSIEDDQLWLLKTVLPYGAPPRLKPSLTIKDCFGTVDKVLANWYTGKLHLLVGEILIYLTGGQGSTHEGEIILEIEEGRLISIQHQDNYKLKEEREEFYQTYLAVEAYVKRKNKWYRKLWRWITGKRKYP